MMLENLRHRVVIQKPVETQDSNTGAITTTWQDIATVWAAIEPLSVKEIIAAQAEDSKMTGRITIRYRSDIDHSYRLYHAAKNMIYNIEGVLADKESGLEYITLPVSEGVRYTQAPAIIPVVLTYPEITGTPQDGQTLTASTGLWANEPETYTYQWYVNDIAVSGAVSSTWIIDALVNDIVTVGVVASNGAGGSVEAFSDGVIVE